MVERVEAHPSQARLWVKPDFCSVHFVRGSTSSHTPACSAAGWAHTQWRNPHSAFSHKWEGHVGAVKLGLAMGHVRLLARCPQDIYLICSARMTRQRKSDLTDHETLTYWNWFPDSQNGFLRTVFIVYLLHTLLWQWCVNSQETGTTFLIDLLDSCIVWQHHDYKGCSVSVPLHMWIVVLSSFSLHSPPSSKFSQSMKFLCSLYCELMRWIQWCDSLW